MLVAGCMGWNVHDIELNDGSGVGWNKALNGMVDIGVHAVEHGIELEYNIRQRGSSIVERDRREN